MFKNIVFSHIDFRLAMSTHDKFNLRNLIPLNTLTEAQFEKLYAENNPESLSKGQVLFQQGDTRNEFIYVLSGNVSLQIDGSEMDTISGGTAAARLALTHQFPRKFTAIAKDPVTILRVASAYVNPTEEPAVQVNEEPEDWMAALLKSPIFQRMSPASLHNFLSKLEEIQVKAGHKIIQQDDPGDYYYVIKKGICAVTRKPSRLAKEIKLAELKTGDAFGEDSLISDQARNVTVTMMNDGILLRLEKSDFLELVKIPSIHYLDTEQTRRLKSAIWLDVRSAAAFEENHLDNAVNIPFFELRMDLSKLDKARPYILVCGDGKTSESAAFLLIRHGFDAYVLKGGMGEPAVKIEINQEESPEDQIHRLQEQISSLTAELQKAQEQDQTIKSLRNELTQSAGENAMLQIRLKRADQEIAGLKSNLEAALNQTPHKELINIKDPLFLGALLIAGLLIASIIILWQFMK